MLLTGCHCRLTGSWQVSGQQHDGKTKKYRRLLSRPPPLRCHDTTWLSVTAQLSKSIQCGWLQPGGRRAPRSHECREKTKALLYTKAYATCHDKTERPACAIPLWRSLSVKFTTEGGGFTFPQIWRCIEYRCEHYKNDLSNWGGFESGHFKPLNSKRWKSKSHRHAQVHCDGLGLYFNWCKIVFSFL